MCVALGCGCLLRDLRLGLGLVMASMVVCVRVCWFGVIWDLFNWFVIGCVSVNGCCLVDVCLDGCYLSVV